MNHSIETIIQTQCLEHTPHAYTLAYIYTLAYAYTNTQTHSLHTHTRKSALVGGGGLIR